ncbi:MAG TPA: AMP-binding protein [Streptosporangiaceae bacterium]|jgi:acyl-CoA synthetase (AMP-forming)/AMP-acid ligase II
MIVIQDWIRSAKARRGAAAYLEDARGPAGLSYAGLARAARGWAHVLDQAEVPPGVGVAIRLADPVSYATALVAVLAAGRVAVPLDPAAPAARLGRVLSVARPAAAVCDAPDGLPPGLPLLRPPGPGLPPGAGRSAPPGLAGGGGIFLCTSGTTGTPKGILLTEDQLGHVADCVARHHRLTAADRGYCPLPLFHVNAQVVGLLSTLRAAAALVLDRKFSRRGFWPLMAGRQITWINAVPAIIAVLALDPPVLAPDPPVSATVPAASPHPGIRFVRSASAPLPPSVLARFEAAFGLPVLETYGMTEAASMITASPLDGPRKPGSAGRPAGARLRIARPDRPQYEPCPAFETGRVQIRGRGVIRRYAAGGREGAIGRDGWLDTGDLGHLDQDGYLFLAGRTDDVINRGGEKIYPREIEDFLLAQPGVSAAAVVAAPDPVLGACPVAWIVPADARPDLADALRAACDRDLPRPLRPRAVRLLAELPLGPTGKPDRIRLQHAAARDGEEISTP